MRLPRERGAKRICSLVAILSLLSVFGSPGFGRLPINLAGSGAVASSQPATPATAGARLNPDVVQAAYGQLPMRFEPNSKGSGTQAARSAQFVSRGAGYTLMFNPTEVLMSLNAAVESDPGLAGTKQGTSTMVGPLSRQSRIRTSTSALLRMRLVGANPKAKMTGEHRLSGKNNYLIGKDPAAWVTDVATYGRVMSQRVYSGIDVVYYGNNQHLEYDFIVSPGADPKAIGLAFDGAQRMRIDRNGDLVLTVQGREVRHKKPVAFQEANGIRKEVAARYVLKGRHRASIRVGAYDTRRELVIDPELIYSTYFGKGCVARDIALDSAGNIYLTGYTDSAEFPASSSAFQGRHNNPADGPTYNLDAFVTKLSAAGDAVVYSTYLGGRGADQAAAIAVNSQGNAHVVGGTSSDDFPTTPGALKSAYVNTCSADSQSGNCSDGFVAALNATGSALVYSSYLGGSDSDGITEIALDPSGNAYTVGVTLSPDFPVSIGAFQTGHKGKLDLFVTKIDQAGALIYSTFLGGSDYDGGWYDFYFEQGIAVDHQGNAFVTAYTQSSDFPVTAGAFQTTFKVADAFVTKLNASGSGLVYSTFLGGQRDDGGFGIAVDSAGNAYVAGATRSTDFPTANPFQRANSSVPLTRSSDGGNKWSAVELPNPSIVSLSFASNDSRKLFVGLDKKLWVSNDNGQNWRATGLSGTRTYDLEFDRVNPKNVYARTFYYESETGSHGAVYKSTDGGDTWNPTSLSGAFFTKIIIAPSSPSTIFASSHSFRVNSPNGVFRSTDGGQTWTAINGGLSHDERQVSSLAVDPANSSIIYIGTLKGVFKSIDGGQTWNKTSIGDAVLALEMDPDNPSTLYASTDEFEGNVTLTLDDPNGRVNPRRRFLGSSAGQSDLFKSIDGAATWRTIGNGLHPNPYVEMIRIDPRVPSTIYLLEDRGVFKTTKGGESWERITITLQGITLLEIDPHDSTVYTGVDLSFGPTIEAFIAKLNASGSALIYSSYLGGVKGDRATDLTVDSQGNAYVIGYTDSREFNTTPNALDRTFGGSDLVFDLFVSKVSPIGQLLYSSYLGGKFYDSPGGIALRGDGTAFISGFTASEDFPVIKAYQSSLLGPANPHQINAFIVGLSIPDVVPPVGPKINGASVSGKKLLVRGENFAAGAIILLDGKEQSTVNDGQEPEYVLMSKKAGKKCKPGREVALEVRNPDGFTSGLYRYTR